VVLLWALSCVRLGAGGRCAWCASWGGGVGGVGGGGGGGGGVGHVDQRRGVEGCESQLDAQEENEIHLSRAKWLERGAEGKLDAEGNIQKINWTVTSID